MGLSPINFSNNEIPTGIQNGINVIFTLEFPQIFEGSILISSNGSVLANGLDYLISGQTITFTIAPKSTDILRAFYAYGNNNPGFINLSLNGNIDGSNTIFSTPISISSNSNFQLYFNGQLLDPILEYTLTNNIIQLTFPPHPTDILLAYFQTPDYYYHAPVFLNTVNDQYINIGNITGNFIQYQFKALDFEYNTVNFKILNNTIPNSNLSINASTGWLTGYIDNNYNQSSAYTFNVAAYKKITESIFGVNPFQSTLPVYLTVENQDQKNLIWKSSSNLGNIIPGVPSTISFNAEIINPDQYPAASGASANASLKVVNANIINGGANFSIGEWFVVPGGISSSNANIIITGNTANGAISSISIVPGPQQYTTLPNISNVIWNNPNGLNAIIDLNFGIDTINVVSPGKFYNSALIGFEPAGETSQASAISSIRNGEISNIVVSEPGNNYTAIPKIIITEREKITSNSPVYYKLTSGMIPTGLKLLSNGLLVGIPSFQYFGFNDNVLINDNTTFDREFSFTVTAYIGSNKSINFTESDISDQNNIISTDFQWLAKVPKTFNLKLTPSKVSSFNQSPKTNLSLEFLLSDDDYTTLISPLLNQSIIPNSVIYRSQDFYFGKANTIRMLIGYGIAAETPTSIIDTINQFYHRKTFLLTNLKLAYSTTDGYEVIYIQPLDEYTDLSGNTYSGSISTSDNILYPSTIPNMINQLNTTLSGFDENFLPTWMTDVQPNGQILGFVPAIPLVYVKPGFGDKIKFYLQQYYDTIGPKLNTIAAETDRFTWNYGVLQNWNISTNTWNLSELTVFDEGSIYLKFKNSRLGCEKIVSI